METITEKRSRIKRSGIDKSLENHTTEEYNAIDNEKPEQQKRTLESQYSNEQPVGTNSFGIEAPLAGLSRLLRRFASRYKKSGFGHWLPLIFADKTNIWEGFLSKFRRGFIPVIFSGKRMKARQKKHLIATTTVRVLATAFVFAWLITSSRRKKKGAMKKT